MCDKSNCYGYAVRLNLSIIPGYNNDETSAVGDWSEGLDEYPFEDSQKGVLMDACIQDGLTDNGDPNKQIAVFVDEYEDCIDYHFIRLDGDGTWSCQDSTGGPITTGIEDPVVWNAEQVGKQLATGELKGQMYAGMLYLPDDFEWEM